MARCDELCTHVFVDIIDSITDTQFDQPVAAEVAVQVHKSVSNKNLLLYQRVDARHVSPDHLLD